MAKTNAERQETFREWRRQVGRCATGGCQQIAHPHRKCALCRRKEADQKAAKRREAAEELRELDLLRDQVRKLEDQNTWLEERNALLVQQVSALNKYNILATEFDDMMASFKDEYSDD